MITTHYENKFRWIRETVKTHFDFLLQQGFDIVSVMFTTHGMDDWQIMLLSDGCFVRVRCERGRITLGISDIKLLQNHVGFFDLGTILEMSTQENEAHTVFDRNRMNEGKQIEEMASLLRKYSNDIFRQFDILSSFILSRLWLISEANQNGRLSMDSRPFSFFAEVRTKYSIPLLHLQ